MAVTPYLSQIILYAPTTLFVYENKTKGSSEYALYLALFLIVCKCKVDIYGLSYLNVNEIYKNYKYFCL